MAGWIKLHRVIREHAFFKERRKFSRFEAWIDMLLEANHADKEFLLGNEIITCERASFITSELKLMARWGWSKSKVRAFLKLLEVEQMIVKKTDSKKTAITIVKYDFYQGEGTTEEPQKNREETAKRPQKDTTKNVKNDKEEKKKIVYAEFVKMTGEEHAKLIAAHGAEDTAAMIQILDNYKGATGKKYKSDYRAILNWVVDRLAEEKRKKPLPPPKPPEPEFDYVFDEEANAMKKVLKSIGKGMN